MTYWTVLVLTFFLEGNQMQSRLLFPSMKSCGQALDVIYRDHVEKYFPNSMGQCEKSGVTSKDPLASLKPKPRPAWLENGEKK